MQNTVRVLIFQGTSGLFVAHCLDYDFAAQGSTAERALEAFEKAFRLRCQIAEQRGEAPFQNAARAPSEYWQRFEAAAPASYETSIRAQIHEA